MLLCVLQKMNDLIGKIALSEYSVELEKQEDFVIIHCGKSETFHQVKATLSKSKWSSHVVALDKLLQHRNSSDNPAAVCYFISAKEIDDWNETSNTYSTSISLYKYMDKNVGTIDVKTCIISEIKKLILTCNYKSGIEEVIYGELCLFIDEQIAIMHQQSAKKRVYSIAFSDFENIISQSIMKEKNSEEFYLKESVYEYSTKGLQQALENICTHKCHKALSTCEITCAAKTAYQGILSLPDLVRYCRVINPSRIDGWDNALKLISDMPQDKMEREVLRIFMESQTPDKVDANQDAVFLHTKFCKAINGCIIPTLLDLSSYYLYDASSLQETFQSIKDNVEILDVLDGNAITAIPGGYEGSLTQAQITSGWIEGTENDINSFYHGIEIISQKELLERFKVEGGNHD